MPNETSETTRLLLSVLFFPTFFQGAWMAFAWGQGDPPEIAMAKRVLLLLPVAASLVGIWASILCLLTTIIRQRRQEFVTALLATWWDLFKSIFSFWGGIIRFLIVFAVALLELMKVLLLGVWIVIQDLILIPFRVLRGVAANVLSPGIPWIAVVLTLAWCLVEAMIFTYVMSPLVIDTLSNLTGDQLTDTVIRIPLFFFMLLLILGSYSVLSTWSDAIKSKNVASIIKISVIEFVALMVEVLFLYREFVDSLVPWFAQHSQGFELGIVGTLAVAFFAWLGIRGMSWFLFAAHGTPTIMAIIQGAGLKGHHASESVKARDTLAFTSRFASQMKADLDWAQSKGDEVLGAFILPPLQVVAAAINFCTLLITGQHLFELPFKSLREVMDPQGWVRKQRRQNGGGRAKAEAT